MEDGEREYLRTCEVYNILTEWQFIAGKTLRRTFRSMVLWLFVRSCWSPKRTLC